MHNQSLVSICIPSYNSENFIAETLKSVLGQTYPWIEVVISDDASGDRTVEIAESFRDDRIKIFKNEKNAGVEGNWNKTMLMSTGKYIKVMGADDILVPTCIEEQLKILENPANADVMLVSCHKKVINQNGTEVVSIRFPGKGKIDGPEAIRRSLRRGTNVIGEPAAGLFRAETLKRSGMFNGENVYLIDLDFWSRILKFGKLFVVDKSLYAFRISHRSISAGMGFKQYVLYNAFVTKLAEDKSFHLTWVDKLMARGMSMIMVMVRQVFHLGYFMKK